MINELEGKLAEARSQVLAELREELLGEASPAGGRSRLTSAAADRFGSMLDRLRQRLDLLPNGPAQREAIRRKRDQVICEYLAEYRRLCAEVGPYRYASDLGLPAGLDGPIDYRMIAYAAAWNDMADGCDFIDEAITAAVAGFNDWQGE